MVRRAAVGLLFVVIMSGCAARSPRAYVRVAEALTSGHLNEAIYVAAPRLAPDQVDRGCRSVREIARLGTPSTYMQMRVGAQFALGGLSVIAVDAADVTIAGVPLAIEAQDQTPPVLDLRRDNATFGRGVLQPLNPGMFKLRLYTLCNVAGAETIIDVKVVLTPIP